MIADPLASLRAALLQRPVLLFIAGPNGAGKTTFFEYYVEPLGLPYVNADRVARVLRDAEPGLPQDALDRRAFTEAERLRDTLVETRTSFCTETVFSDPVGAKVVLLEKARAAGYCTTLVFIGLAAVELSVMRVVQRVRQGGHDVPDAKLRERFPRTVVNLRAAIPVVDEAYVLDNSAYATPYRALAIYRTHGSRAATRRSRRGRADCPVCDVSCGRPMSALASWFDFEGRRTTLGVEVRAGVTTFMVMAYIIFVNPIVLGYVGVPGLEGKGLPLIETVGRP